MTKLKIAIQGDPGSNHDLVTRKLLANREYELVCCASFPELFSTLESGAADMGVMAIENSIAGSILGNFDLLSKHPRFKVVGEGYLRIEHCLMGLPEAELEDIKIVYSHEMALKQCEDFIARNQLEAREYFDTAASVPYVKSKGKKELGAIAPFIAAELYGLKVIQRGVESNKENYTRFVVLSAGGEGLALARSAQAGGNPSEGNQAETKVMLELELAHKVGSLVQALQKMAELGLNLTKIESRPIIGQSWHYRFYIDCITRKSEAEVVGLLGELRPFIEELNVLGIFPPGETFQP